MWQLILSAPFFRSLELAVPDEDGVHALKNTPAKGLRQEGCRSGARVLSSLPLARLD